METSVTCFSSIEKCSRSLIFPFAVTDFHCNTPEAPLSEKYKKHTQKIKIQDFTMIFEYSFNDHSRIASFVTLIKIIFPFPSFAYQIRLKEPTYISPNSVQISLFPLKGTKVHCLKLK